MMKSMSMMQLQWSKEQCNRRYFQKEYTSIQTGNSEKQSKHTLHWLSYMSMSDTVKFQNIVDNQEYCKKYHSMMKKIQSSMLKSMRQPFQ